uniref:hypothetical protein n=1 Tax=Limosilactobacillus fermentum TaxID=1613 RepID=UPI001C9E20FF
NEGIRKAAMWAPIQFKRDRPNEDLRLPSVIIFKDNVCEMKIGAFFCALKTKKSCQRITTMVIHQQDLV